MTSRRSWPPFLAFLPVVAVLLVVPMALAEAPAPVHGLAPLPDDQKVPLKLLPPGAFDPDSGPSDVIFPQQQMTLRFNHAKHLSKDVGATCKTCHGAAFRSTSATDTLIPAGVVCDACHSTDHTDAAKVTPGDEAMGQCAFCHRGYKPGDGNVVAELQLPRANLLFNHKVHVDRNIGCPQCHGAVDQLELATRDQLPRMRGCFHCHQMPDAASRGTAKSACDTCHLRGDRAPENREGPGATAGALRGTVIKTMFASGTLSPPRWLHNAEHTPDFILRHRTVAADDSAFCANCHKEDFCTDCHDGRVRPRSIHPSDYLNMHPIEARMSTQSCKSCHHEQSFCLDCHLRVGVAESSPPNAKDSGRFHPPKSLWSDPPRKPGHHSFEAERNLNACVSCHIERDCVACHGALGVGAGFDPHQNGFLGGCSTQLRRNPRPCFVCHEKSDPVLAKCQ
jgi:cytochrome c7-like protein